MFNLKVHAMRILRSHPLALALALSGILPAAHAAQSTVGVGTLTNGTSFSVRYVNDKFVAVNGTAPGVALGMDVPVWISTATLAGPDGATGIKSFSVWLKVHGQDAFGQTSFDAHKVTKTNPYSAIGGKGYVGYPVGQNADVHLNVPLSAMLQTAAARCNAKLASLMASGMSREQAISQDQKMTLAVQPVLRYELFPTQTVTEEGNRPWSEFRKIEIVCEAPGAGPQARGTTSTMPGATKPGTGPALLTQVNLSIQQPPSPAQCPAEITARMTFRASAMNDSAQPLAPGWFSYRVRSASGRVSRSDMVTFQESDRQGLVFVKTIEQKFSVPLPGSGNAPGGSGQRPGAAGGLAVQQNDGNTGVAPAGHSRPGAAGNYAGGGSPTPPNVHADSLWVDITGGKSGSVQKSDYAAYNVTCQLQPVQLGGGGGVTANPGPNRPTTHPGAQPQTAQLPTAGAAPARQPVNIPSGVPATPTFPPPGAAGPSTPPRHTPSFPPPGAAPAVPGTAKPAPSMPAGTRSR